MTVFLSSNSAKTLLLQRSLFHLTPRHFGMLISASSNALILRIKTHITSRAILVKIENNAISSSDTVASSDALSQCSIKGLTLPQ